MILKFVILLALVAAPALCSSIKGYSGQRSEEPKGGRQVLGPVEYQRRLSEQPAKGAPSKQTGGEQLKLEQIPASEEKIEQFKQQEQQVEQVKEEKIEQYQQREESVQQKLEFVQEQAPTKGRYEAKPQLSREEQLATKGGQQQQQQQQQQLKEESGKARVEQQREEASKTSKGFQQQQRVEEPVQQIKIEQQKEQQQQEKFEQQQQQRSTDFDSQIELKEEQQRRYDELPALVQPVLPLTVVDEPIREQRIEQQAATKGGYVQAAPGAPFGEAEPYAFSYQVEGSSRSESGDTKGVVRGQYTLQGADGSSRIVDYIADHNGFRASVNTNEFGTEQKSPAAIALRTSQPNAEDITLRLEGKTKEDLAGPAAAAPSKTSYTKESWSQNVGAATKGGEKRIEQVSYQQQKIEQAPAKGAVSQQRFDSSELYQQQEQQLQAAAAPAPAPAPVKSSEKLLAAAPAPPAAKSAEHRAFESATAHRAYKAPLVSSQRKQASPPAILLRQQPPQAPVRAYQPAVSRSYLRAERYPPAAARGAASGQHVNPPPAGVSFYSQGQPATGPINFDEDVLPGFAESEQ